MSGRVLLIAFGCIACVYTAICILLYVKQDALLFFPVSSDAVLARQWQPHRVEIANAEASIEGWWAENPRASSDVVILYFGGNAEDVLYAAESFKQLNAKRMLVTNYRGYGATRGRPSEQALFRDALAIYDYAASQPSIAAKNIVVMGRSLGSGIATYIAANRKVRCAVLITPYDSIASVAQGHYPYFPVRWLLRHSFPSAEFAPRVSVPVVMIAGERDDVIPPKHAQRLFESWAGPKQIHVLKGVGHNNIEQHADYYMWINALLNRPAT